ncbi:MAG: hypothetical protein SH808_13740 [Saprospiraceae bacterium]|nr:hypothetical protein [Saprospiraceae bacterium]
MKLHPLQHSFSFSLISLFCILSIFWTACKPTSTSSDELISTPQIDGEAISFLGDTLRSPEIDVEAFLRMDSLLQEAKVSFLDDSSDLQAIIWYGRRLAYVHRYKDAIKVFSDGIHHHPLSPELYRHRGHRYITIRQPNLAIADLRRASVLAEQRQVEIEPDGIPNKLDIPLSNLHFNIYYHLGLAYYLQADFSDAIASFQCCMQYANNPDLMVATTYWLYLTYLRAGDHTIAKELLGAIHTDMEIIENDEYLRQLLLFQAGHGDITESGTTSESTSLGAQQYGISCWYEANGRRREAAAIRSMILADEEWQYFGYISAEADSASMLTQ